MEVSISYQNAPKGFVSLFFYQEDKRSMIGFSLKYWCVFAINERLKLVHFLNDHGITKVILLNLSDSDKRMFTYLANHFDFEIAA